MRHDPGWNAARAAASEFRRRALKEESVRRAAEEKRQRDREREERRLDDSVVLHGPTINHAEAGFRLYGRDPATFRARLARILSEVAPAVRAYMRAYYTVDSCIPATRIALDTLAAFGVVGAPFPCEVFALNEVVADFLVKNNRLPDGVEESEALLDAGGHMVVIGGESTAKTIGGHLVATVSLRPRPGAPVRDFLIDLSADQMNRPHYGIHIERPIILPLDETSVADGVIPVALPEWGMVVYKRKDGLDYNQSPGWTRHFPADVVTQIAVNAIATYAGAREFDPRKKRAGEEPPEHYNCRPVVSPGERKSPHE